MHLYLILDTFSRKIVSFEVHDTDDSLHATRLIKRSALAESVHAMAEKPVLHGDNGATFKAATVLTMLHWLGIKPSYSRPHVSDDNAFVESLFHSISVPRSPTTERDRCSNRNFDAGRGQAFALSGGDSAGSSVFFRGSRLAT